MRHPAVLLVALLALGACRGRVPPEPLPLPAPEVVVPVDTAPPAIELPPPEPVAQPLPVPPAPKPTPEVAPAARAADAARERERALIARGERMPREEVGYYMDVLEARLRQVSVSGLRVLRSGEVITLILPAGLSFDVNSAQLSTAGRDALGSLARVLADYRLTMIALQGHSDASGDAVANQRLSEQRAMSVAREFVARGINGDRMLVTGYGSERPLGGNNTPEGREMNRRVEIRLTPLTAP